MQNDRKITYLKHIKDNFQECINVVSIIEWTIRRHYVFSKNILYTIKSSSPPGKPATLGGEAGLARRRVGVGVGIVGGARAVQARRPQQFEPLAQVLQEMLRRRLSLGFRRWKSLLHLSPTYVNISHCSATKGFSTMRGLARCSPWADW